MKFNWNNFRRKYFRCLNKNSLRDGSSISNLYALRLFSLAWRDSCHTNELSAQDLRELGLNHFGFDYDDFSGNRQLLRKQLLSLGAILLTNQDGTINYYLRTIQYYSGKVYLKFFDDIVAAKRMKSWDELLVPGVIEAAVSPRMQRVQGLRDDEMSPEDIGQFFRTLIERFLETNASLSVAEIMQIRPIPEAVAKKICEAMSEGNGFENLEIRPKLTLHNNVPCYEFPERGYLPDSFESPVIFRVYAKRDGDDYKFVRYRRAQSGEDWILDSENLTAHQWERFFEVSQSASILRKAKALNSQDVLEETFVQVLPQCATMQDHVVIKRLPDDELKFILPGNENEILKTGDCFYICGIDECEPQVRVGNEDGQSVPIECNGLLTVPSKAIELLVNDSRYELGALNKWISSSAREPWFSPSEYGGRRFVAWSDDSYDYLSEEAQRVGPIELKYNIDGQDYELTPACCWKRGSLVVISNGTRIKIPLTFVSEIEWGECFESAVPYGEEINPKVRIGNRMIDSRDIQVDYEKSVVTVAYRSTVGADEWYLCRHFIQEGVYFSKKNGEERIVVPEELSVHDIVTRKVETKIPHIAKRDFETMKCRIEFADIEGSQVLLTRGNRHKEILDLPAFNAYRTCSSDAELSLSSSNDYCVCLISDNQPRCYKFKVYDSILEPVVHEINASGDLIVDYYSPYVEQGVIKYLACVSAHRQDSELKFLQADRVIYSKDEQTSRLNCHLTFSNIAQKIHDANLEWGAGLICFVSCSNDGRRIPISTRGFFVGNPHPNLENLLKNDVLSDLRSAMATCDWESIGRIMRGDDRHEEIATFISRMTENMKRINAFDYLNAYRNILHRGDGTLQDNSGYVFMASWFFRNSENLKRKGILDIPYRGHWDPLMFDWDMVPTPNITGDQMLNFIIIRRLLTNIGRGNQLWLRRKTKDISKKMRDCGLLMFDGDGQEVFRVHNDVYFTYAQVSEAVRKYLTSYSDVGVPRMLKDTLVRKWQSYLRNPSDEALDDVVGRSLVFNRWADRNDMKEVLDFLKERSNAPYLFYTGYADGSNLEVLPKTHIQKEVTLKAFLRYLGKCLSDWRDAPTLSSTANKLRDHLLQLGIIDFEICENADEELRGILYSPLRMIVNAYAYEYKNGNRQQYWRI